MKAIIFDFDGTIADTLSQIISIAYKLTKNPALTNSDQIEKMRKRPLTEVLTELNVPKYKWLFLIYKGQHIMSKNMSQVKLFQGIDMVIKELYKSGFSLYLVSSNSESNIKKFLINNNLDKYFLKIRGQAGLHGKARSLKKMIKKNKLDSKNTLVIGDEVRDIVAAKAAGVDSIAVSWGFNETALLEASHPYAMVNKTEGILEIVKKWETNKNG